MIALITGATAGIGKATAEKFAKEGLNIIITGRRCQRLENLKKELTDKYNVKIKSLCFDIRDRNAVEKNILSLDNYWQQIDILVNNAGLALGFEPIHNGNPDDWEIMIDTNIKGLLYISRLIINMMIKRKKGHIINVSSIAGKEVYLNGNVYCATKHAVEALTKAMRMELINENIKVSSVAPGKVHTEFSLVRFKGDKERADKVYEGYRALSAEDIAEVIWFIASRPPHVNVADVLVITADQADTRLFKNNFK